jgi:hypothetical protein
LKANLRRLIQWKNVFPVGGKPTQMKLFQPRGSHFETFAQLGDQFLSNCSKSNNYLQEFSVKKKFAKISFQCTDRQTWIHFQFYFSPHNGVFFGDFPQLLSLYCGTMKLECFQASAFRVHPATSHSKLS